MSATAFQRMRRERAAKKLAEEAKNEADQEHLLTNKEIKAILDQKGIKYDARANKETLIRLLEGAE